MKVKAIERHVDYDPVSFDHDVALIELEASVPATETIKPSSSPMAMNQS